MASEAGRGRGRGSKVHRSLLNKIQEVKETLKDTAAAMHSDNTNEAGSEVNNSTIQEVD